MVAAAVVDTVHAPPAIVFLHDLQCQMPTAVRFTESCDGLRIAAQRAHGVFTDLAAKRAGVPGMLGDFHLKIMGQQTRQPEARICTFLTCLRREAP